MRHLAVPSLLAALAAASWLAPLPAAAQRRSALDEAREKMVDEAVAGAGVQDARVLRAMKATPRHEFVPVGVRNKAYLDMSLPIGDAQTISSPFIVAYMTECLDPQPTDRVLEIGTGSGYQAAVLSPLVREVYTIEIVESLGRRAQRTLNRLRYDNVHVKVGDGFQGWPEHAPFDKIIVTCSPEKVPQPLVEQLEEGGLMVVPVGERYQQTLYLMRKQRGKLVAESLRPTLFVPMTGTAESRRQVQPDPGHPQLVNGDFEELADDRRLAPGWYYQRLLEVAADQPPTSGGHYAQFKNSEPGRAAHVMQGLAIDGRQIAELQLSAQVRPNDVRVVAGGTFPTVALTFYDEHRKEIATRTLGPVRGTADWYSLKRTVRVPLAAREAILRIGLFGATGEIAFDDIELRPLKPAR